MNKNKPYKFKVVFEKFLLSREADGIDTKTQRSRFKRLSKFHNTNMSDIVPEQVLNWKVGMVQKGYKTGTIRETHSLAIAIFNFANEYNMIGDVNPFKKVNKAMSSPKKLRIFNRLDLDNITFITLTKHESMHNLFHLARYTGMRPSELARLTKRSYINEKQLRVRTKNKNNHRERIIYVPDHLVEWVKQLPWPADPEEPLFKNVKQMQKKFNRIVNDLGFNKGITQTHEKLTFYSLRHTFCTKLVQSGTPLPVVQEITGHRSFKSLERYIHLETDVVQKALNNVEL